MPRRKKKLKLQRQHYLLLALGVVVVLGLGYVLSQQQGLGGYLKGAVGGQCSPAKVDGKVYAGPAQRSGQTEAIARNNALQALKFKCPVLPKDSALLKCPKGCAASAAPQCVLIGLAPGSLGEDRPNYTIVNDTTQNGKRKVTVSVTGTCQCVQPCSISASTSNTNNGTSTSSSDGKFTCTPSVTSTPIGKSVTFSESTLGGHFKANWTTEPNSGADPSGSTTPATSWSTKFTTAGKKTITATSTNFPGETRTATCTITVEAPEDTSAKDNFTCVPTRISPTAGQPVSFNAIRPDGKRVLANWGAPDGNPPTAYGKEVFTTRFVFPTKAPKPVTAYDPVSGKSSSCEIIEVKFVTPTATAQPVATPTQTADITPLPSF